LENRLMKWSLRSMCLPRQKKINAISQCGDHFQFKSIFIKKKSKLKIIFWKKNRNRFKPTGFGSVRFFRTKPVQTVLARFFPVWLSFSCLARFFLVWVRFGSVRFFFIFCLLNWNRTEQAGFFKISIGLISFF